MPHFASNEDRSLQSTIEEWKLTARSELDDIEAWRDAVDERSKHLGDSSRYWWDEPNGFYAQTTYLVGVIVSCYPKLDPAPLRAFYAAVQAWHVDHNATRVPAQNELNTIADQAVLALNAIERTIQSRISRLEEVREQTNEHFVLIDSWTPFGWEGMSPDRVLNSVAELAAWIDDQLFELNALADMNDGRGSFYLDTANQSLRNAFRAMDRLRISHPWQQPEATADPLVAEQRLRNLRQALQKQTLPGDKSGDSTPKRNPTKKKRGNRGGKRRYDATLQARAAKAWATGRYKKYAELEAEIKSDMSLDDLQKMIESYNKAQARRKKRSRN